MNEELHESGEDFADFLEAVANSSEDEVGLRDTRHTSSISSDDWKRVAAARLS
ncbi:hypothetical protein [Kitasatospora kifunensis]|uniref:Uncharacterized protein n=1 Tax=Kitasatospora kifunensis TaxID=58351 RepID=A0A7W7VYD1_KITKI|nr:hypothetical protein [Kitasatospora kifunensis]MBB4926923.1 hypothetical protein [Kitasatospora kifunensis]